MAMQSIKSMSLKRKLIMIMMATSCTAIILMALLVMVNQAINSQRTIQQQLITLADVLGSRSTGAITFDDQATGKEILSALAAKPHIIYAVIERVEGGSFAEFGDQSVATEVLLLPLTDDSSPLWNNLLANKIHVARDIYLEMERIGRIRIVSSLEQLEDDLINYMLLLAVIACICFVITFLICTRLQKVVSEPIVSLQNAMSLVSENKDYSLRVENKQDNELGVLVEGFNHMLQQIQMRDMQLARHSINLEKTIVTRTLELDQENQKRILWLETMAKFLRHELKNSSVGIKTSLDLIERRSLEKKKVDIYLARARKSMASMNALLQSAGNASNLEAILYKEQHHCLDLSAVMLEHLDSYLAVYPDCVFKVDCQPDIWVLGNELRLQQLLDKLIANAVEHSDSLSTAIEVCLQLNAGKAQLFVKNIGAKLPKDKKAMFDLFVSLRTSERKTDENFGLGLYIVKLIAESHAGQVNAYDLSGETGAVFELTLPIVAAE